EANQLHHFTESLIFSPVFSIFSPAFSVALSTCLIVFSAALSISLPARSIGPSFFCLPDTPATRIPIISAAITFLLIFVMLNLLLMRVYPRYMLPAVWRFSVRLRKKHEDYG